MSALELGTDGWPPISTWINPPPLGSNVIYCVDFPRKRGNNFLNMNLGELRALLEKLHCLVYGRLSWTCCWWGWICSTNLLSQGLTRHCVGTIVGEEIIFAFSSTICFCWTDYGEAAVVVVAFCASCEQNVKRMNFAVWDITLRHCFGGIIVITTSGIL